MPKTLYPLAADREFVESAIHAGALVKINPSVADELKHCGFALLFCGDCDHSQDAVDHLEENFDTPRIHYLAVNGGAILLDPRSPANRPFGFADAVHEQIRQTFEMKEFIHLFLDIHVPCGAARANRIPAIDAVRSVLVGKQRLIEDPRRPARLKKISSMLRYFDGIEQRTWVFQRATMVPFIEQYLQGDHLQPASV